MDNQPQETASNKVDRYLALAMRHLALDPAGEDFQVAEDTLTDEMDRVWFSMEPAEIIEAKHIVSSAVFGLTGKPKVAPDDATADPAVSE